MKIVHYNHFNHCMDNARSSYYYYWYGEVKMLKMFFIFTICIGGAYGFGYFEGQISAEERIFGKNVKRVDKRRRRY